MSLMRKFAEDCKGSIATIFAISAVPILIAAGVAIDMVQVNAATSVLQGAADAAALAAASSGKTNINDVKAVAKKFLAANGAENVLALVTDFDVVPDEKKGTISVSIKGQRPTALMHLAGIDMVSINAFAEVKLPADGIEVAMVLDVTGSMNAGGRLPALKSAATDFVDSLMKAEKTGAYVRLGIVPFSQYVNVGLAARTKPWMSVPADTKVVLPEVCSIQYPNRQWNNCTPVQRTGYDDGQPYTYTSYENCTVVDGPAVKTCYKPVNESKWYGCVGSRNNPLDESIGKLSNRYPGIPNVGCNDELLPLGKDEAKLKAKINGLVASGETYIPTGLLWGWNMVDGEAPLDEGKSAAEIKAKGGIKAIVLMTDGENTISATYPRHDAADRVVADDKVKNLCKNIKKDDIVIYTISFMVTDPNAISLLEKCATDKAKAFTADNASQLTQAFDEIGSALMAMRLSK